MSDRDESGRDVRGRDAGEPGEPLDALQRWMHSALVFPGRTEAETTERLVEPGPQLTAEERLGIYQRSYILRLLKCLAEQYPALSYALGEELFRDFAREYLRDRPPQSYTLYDLGRRFPAYLEETRPDKDAEEGERESWIDFMVDLARFERQIFVLFDAPGHEGKPFAGPETPDARLCLQRCFALGNYRFPVADYYHAVREQREPAIPPPRRTLVALVRKDYLTHTFPLSPAHYAFLLTMREGGEVEEALKRSAEVSGVPPTEVRDSWAAPDSIRQRWIAAGFFIPAP